MPEDAGGMDEEEYRYVERQALESKLHALMQEHIDKMIADIAEEHVLPKVEQLIEGLTFQKTNTWGEPKAPPETVREYITRVAQGYLSEEVNHHGKTKKQDGYNWSAHSTRLLWSIERHVKWHLDESVMGATKNLQDTFANQVSKLVNDLMRNMQVTLVADVKKPRR